MSNCELITFIVSLGHTVIYPNTYQPGLTNRER